jgi:Skp family chaperone for outer membrane proteins
MFDGDASAGPGNIAEAVVIAAAVPVVDAVEKTGEVAAATVAAGKSWEREVEVWFNDVRANLTNLDTEAHNKLHELKEALKARLRALIG